MNGEQTAGSVAQDEPIEEGGVTLIITVNPETKEVTHVEDLE